MTLQKAKELIELATKKTIEIEFTCTDLRTNSGRENLVYSGTQLFTPFQLRSLDDRDIAEAIKFVTNH